MSTRSRIAIENSDGTIESVYVHFDGYPAGVGKKLNENYTSEEKVRELMVRGPIRTLGNTIEETEFFNDEEKAEKSLSFRTFMKLCEDSWADYAYIFNAGSWTTYVVR